MESFYRVDSVSVIPGHAGWVMLLYVSHEGLENVVERLHPLNMSTVSTMKLITDPIKYSIRDGLLFVGIDHAVAVVLCVSQHLCYIICRLGFYCDPA